MRVAVDRTLCQGHNRCHQIAPEIFLLDELGYAHTDEDKEVAADAEELVVRAARACPELAIRMRRGTQAEMKSAGPGSASETEGS